MADADPPKKTVLSARAFLFGKPIDTDAPANGAPPALPETELNELAKGTHVITAMDAGRIETEPLTPEELQNIFARLNSAQAAALLEQLRQSAKEAAQYVEIARAAAIDAIKQAEQKPPPPVDDETMELGLYPAIPQKRHRRNAVVTTSNLAKVLTKLENCIPLQLVKQKNQNVTVTLINKHLPPGVKLTFEDCRILDAIGQLYEEGWREITAQMVYNKIWANPIRALVPPAEVERINACIASYAITGFYLTAEDAFYESRKASAELKRCLQVKNLIWAEGGTRADGVVSWRLLVKPPIYAYSQDLMHETIEIRPELLHPEAPRRGKNILFSAYYLAIRIDQAAKLKKRTEVIKMETAYIELFGELDIRSHAGRMRYRRFIEETFPLVLDHFKHCGELDAYQIKTRPDGCIAEITLPAGKIPNNTSPNLGEANNEP